MICITIIQLTVSSRLKMSMTPYVVPRSLWLNPTIYIQGPSSIEYLLDTLLTSIIAHYSNKPIIERLTDKIFTTLSVPNLLTWKYYARDCIDLFIKDINAYFTSYGTVPFEYYQLNENSCNIVFNYNIGTFILNRTIPFPNVSDILTNIVDKYFLIRPTRLNFNLLPLCSFEYERPFNLDTKRNEPLVSVSKKRDLFESLGNIGSHMLSLREQLLNSELSSKRSRISIDNSSTRSSHEVKNDDTSTDDQLLLSRLSESALVEPVKDESTIISQNWHIREAIKTIYDSRYNSTELNGRIKSVMELIKTFDVSTDECPLYD